MIIIEKQDSTDDNFEPDFSSNDSGIVSEASKKSSCTEITLNSSGKELGVLRSGIELVGTQENSRYSYTVKINILNVNIADSLVEGYLQISGLTEYCPVLTTFFQGEIIGSDFSFLTRKWNADESVDRDHWSRFPSFRPMLYCFNEDGFRFDPMNQDEPFIYMRWKELFLVPDHRVKSVFGASFDGFYYVCMNRLTGQVDGIYFHNESEKYQKLTLALKREGLASNGSAEFHFN